MHAWAADAAQDLRDERVAVLYRTNAQSRLFEEALRRMRIEYNIVGGFSFYERAEVKDIIAGPTGSQPTNLLAVGSTLFFTASTAAEPKIAIHAHVGVPDQLLEQLRTDFELNGLIVPYEIESR